MLTLAQAKSYLKLDAAVSPEDALLTDLLAGVLGTFRAESKRRWPATNEPAIMVAVDPLAVPVVFLFVRWADPAVLTADEQSVAGQWLRLTLGHWYENRQSVAVGLNVVEVPHTARMLMNLLREPTL